MVYGYLRVSTDKQDYNSQKQGVDKFAELHEWTIDEYITDEGVSGSKDPTKRNLGVLLDKLNKGDIIIASEISRLGRDLLMVMDILNHCMKIGVKIYTVKDNYVLGDDIQSKVLAFAFGLSAEIERKMIQARTREGLELRKQKGVLLGQILGRSERLNPICEKNKDYILTALQNGKAKTSIAKEIGVGITVLYRWLAKIDYKGCNYYKRTTKMREIEKNESLFEKEAHDKIKAFIQNKKTIPEIHSYFPNVKYEQLYDYIRHHKDLSSLYLEIVQPSMVQARRKERGF